MRQHTAGVIADCLPSQPALLSATTGLGAALELMLESDFDAAAVLSGDQAIGILRPRDLVGAIAAGAGFDQPVAAYVTPGLITIAADTPILDAYRLLLMRNVPHLLVLDAAHKPLGLVSRLGIEASLGHAADPSRVNVASLMSRDLVCVDSTTTIRAAAEEMRRRHSDCVLVREDGKPHGLMTENDVLRFLRQLAKAGAGSAPLAAWRDQPVAVMMSQPVETVEVGADLAGALARLRQSGKNRLIAIDRDGRAVGLLTAATLIEAQHHDLVAMLKAVVKEQATALESDAFRTIVEHLPDCIIVKDVNSVYLTCNANFARFVGRDIAEIVGKRDIDFCPAEIAARYVEDDRRIMRQGTAEAYEEAVAGPNGQIWFHSSKTPIQDDDGKVIGIVVAFSDITERHQEIENMQRRTWALQALRRCNKALVRVDSEDVLLQDVCNAITEDNRYFLAWIGWAEFDAAKSVRIAAAAGTARHYLDGLKVSWGDNELGNGPTGKSIRLNRTEANTHGIDIASYAPWRDRAAAIGIRASISIPLRIEERAVGAVVIYSNNADLFTAAEITLFEEIADNLAFGIQARRIALARDLAMKEKAIQAAHLEEALEDALAAVAAMLEQRDPYTAGHQRAVAALATSIGEELGLDAAHLKAINLAGIVHDIGKIRVPAEILTKPSRLTPIEFAIVKQHPSVGYNLLKAIDFPWPVADIVHQHHESLDGSGYPLGLKGDQILLESRIMTVADIVESMSADRPYRPALGLDAAKAEIQRLRGSKLDPDVVDACLRVLDRGGFTPQILMPAPES